MVLKENCDVNKPPPRRTKKATHYAHVNCIVQTSRSDKISEFSNESGGGYSEDEEDSDDDILNSRISSVVAAAVMIKKKMGKPGTASPTAIEKTRRPLQKLQQARNGRSVKQPETHTHTQEEKSMNEMSRLQSSCSHHLTSALDLGDDTSSEIQALVNQSNLLAPTQHWVTNNNKTDETVVLLVKDLTALTSQNEDAMRQIRRFEQLLCDKDQELEDSRFYNDMNDCANKRMLAFASERFNKQLNEEKQRVANLIKIIQRQQLGGSEYVNQLTGEKCMLQKEMYLMKMNLNEEALLDKQHLKRLHCVVVVTALISAYVALATGLIESFLYIAPFYFLFVLFVIV